MPAGDPTRERAHTLTVRSDLKETGRVRRLVADVAAEAGFSSERAFDMCVAVSEAVANAIEHTEGDGEVRVDVFLRPGRVEVHILGPGEFHLPGRRGERQHRGLGLPLMATLSDHLALYSPAEGGTVVALTFLLRPAGDTGSAPSDPQGRGTFATHPLSTRDRLVHERLVDDLRETARLAEALAEVDRALHSTQDFDEIARQALTAGAKALGADRAALDLRERGGWRVQHVHGWPPETIGRLVPEERNPLGALAARTGETIAVDDTATDPRVEPHAIRRVGIKSVIVAPLLSKRQTTACLYYSFNAGRHRFSAAEVDFVRRLASSLSLALENARLVASLREEVDRLAVVTQVSAASAGSLDPTTLCAQVLSVTRRLLEARAGGVFRLECEAGTWRHAGIWAYPEDLLPAFRSVPVDRNSYLGTAVVQDLPYVTHEATTTCPGSDRRLQGAGLGEDRWIILPAKAKGAVRGALFLAFEGRRAFEPAEISLYLTVAAQLGTALENVHYVVRERDRRCREEERSRQLDLLHEISTVGLSRYGPEAAAADYLSLLANELGLDLAVILELAGGGLLKPLAQIGFLPEPGEDGRQGPAGHQWPTAQVVRTGDAVFVPDARQAAPAHSDPALVPSLAAGAYAVLPLAATSGPYGVIALSWPGPRAFDRADTTFLSALSREIAIGLENIRLYHQTATLAETLQEALVSMPSAVEQVRFGHAYRSASQAAKVGGDFYDVFQLPGGRVGVLVGDVSGSGVEAAALASLTREIMRAYALQSASPRHILSMANQSLIHRDGYRHFVTVALALVDPQTGRVRFSLAGHPPPVLVSRVDAAMTQWRPAPPLGAFADVRYRTGRTKLSPGDLLVFYTDGVTEARRGGRFFGERRLVDRLYHLSSAGPERLPGLLLTEVEAFTSGGLADDAAVVAVGLDGPLSTAGPVPAVSRET